MKQENIFDDFPDTDRKKIDQMNQDFNTLQTSLSPSQKYKKQLFSRLEAISMYQSERGFDLKRYASGILAFTFLMSFIWYFYANFLSEDSIKVPGGEQNEQIFSDPKKMEIRSEEVRIMGDDIAIGSGRMLMPYMRSYTDVERAGFLQACNEAEGFYIPDEEICILEMRDICDISSFISEQENSCSLLFGEESFEEEILPYEGQGR